MLQVIFYVKLNSHWFVVVFLFENTLFYHIKGWAQSNMGLFLRKLYSKTCVKRTLSKRLMQVKSIAECSDSVILLTFIKLPFVIKIFVLSIFWVAILHRFYCTLLQAIKQRCSSSDCADLLSRKYNPKACYLKKFNIVASLVSLAGWIKPYLVTNLEDRFSRHYTILHFRS